MSRQLGLVTSRISDTVSTLLVVAISVATTGCSTDDAGSPQAATDSASATPGLGGASGVSGAVGSATVGSATVGSATADTAGGASGVSTTAGGASQSDSASGMAQGGSVAQGGNLALGGSAAQDGGVAQGGAQGGNVAQGGSVAQGGAASIGGAATAGMGGSGVPAVLSEDYVGDVQVSVHDKVNTILVVTWTQTQAADQVWLEFGFEGGETMTSPALPGIAGEHEEKVLGVPGDTDVTLRIVSRAGGTDFASSDHVGHTDEVPSAMPVPTIEAYEPSLASEDRWLFGAVEDPPLTGSRPSYYNGQFWLYIIDRQGRVVWYFSDPSNNASSCYQRRARDGRYIWVDQGRQGNQGVIKMTLDQEYFETISVQVADSIDVTDDGSLLYDIDGTLWEYTAAGQEREIWSCNDELNLGNCYSNAINWNAADDTVLLSFPDPGAVAEVERSTGTLVGYYGNQPGAWEFAPPLSTPPEAWRFGVQHFPNISEAGTLMVSSHLPPHESFTRTPYPGEHAFIEFAVDRENQVLTELWRYTEGQEWADYKGMAIKMANGNVLANYGTGGVIREVTPDKQAAFTVKFDLPGDDDAFNMMVGHNELINDLYALNGGPD